MDFPFAFRGAKGIFINYDQVCSLTPAISSGGKSAHMRSMPSEKRDFMLRIAIFHGERFLWAKFTRAGICIVSIVAV
jgi:hypothetical protein